MLPVEDRKTLEEKYNENQTQNKHQSETEKVNVFFLFLLCFCTQYVMLIPFTKHVSLHGKYCVKTCQVSLGVADNMHPLSWGGWHKKKRSVFPQYSSRHAFEKFNFFPCFSNDNNKINYGGRRG